MKITLPITALAAVLGLALAGAPVTVQAQTSTTAPATTAPATTAPATTAAAPATAPAKAKPTRFGGILTAVDTTGNTITITDKTKAARTFSIAPTTKITKDKKPATLADFTVGEKVGGSYSTDATGAMTATTLNTNTMKAKAPAAPSATAPSVTAPTVSGTTVTPPVVH
jgi:hypothetical protein